MSLESIERTGSSGGVSSHILKVQPFTNNQFWQINILRNAIHRITSWSKNGAAEGFSSISRSEYQRRWCSMIKEDAVEGLVNSIVDVIQESLLSWFTFIFNSSLG